MLLQLRPYQTEAMRLGLESLREGRNPVLQLATGTGKSLIIAAIAALLSRRGGRVWILTHVQELVEQNARTYANYAFSEPSIVCAGLNRAEYRGNVIIGTIQSMSGPVSRDELEPPSLIIVDEAHRIPHATGEQSQYERIFSKYPQVRRLAMTATPWRMDNGLIYGPTEKGFWFDDLAFTYTVGQGVVDGWLSPIVGVEAECQLEVEDLITGDTFVQAEVGERETVDWLAGVARSVKLLAAKRKHIAVYCPTVVAANRAAVALAFETGWSVALVTGGMARADRQEAIRRFRHGETRVLISVDMLTTGFDFPALDCAVILRPTTSTSLWVQILGRLTRLHDEKKNGLLLDYVGNLQRLGGADVIEKYTRERGGQAVEEVPAEPAERKPKAARRVLPGVRTLIPLDPMTSEAAQDGAVLECEVHAVSAIAIPTRRNPTQPVLMLTYSTTTPEGARIDGSLFVNTEEPDSAAYRFFEKRDLAVKLPALANSVIWQVRGARMPSRVRLRKSGKYWNVTGELFTTPTEAQE